MARSAVEQLALALGDTAELVAGVRDHQWDRPTPCAEWSVRDLVDHLVTGNRLFAGALLEDSPPDGPTSAEPHADRWAAAYRASADTLLTAFGSPGAMDRMVTVPFGTVPGIVALHLRLVEALVHGWDLARATGQPPRGEEGLVEQELEFTRARLADVPPGRSPFGPAQPVADEAPALDRLAACLGRDVDAPAAG